MALAPAISCRLKLLTMGLWYVIAWYMSTCVMWIIVVFVWSAERLYWGVGVRIVLLAPDGDSLKQSLLVLEQLAEQWGRKLNYNKPNIGDFERVQLKSLSCKAGSRRACHATRHAMRTLCTADRWPQITCSNS